MAGNIVFDINEIAGSWPSAILIPKQVRRDIGILHDFVKAAVNCVDSRPVLRDEFYALKAGYLSAVSGEKTGDNVIDSFMDLSMRRDFKKEWGYSFFDSMEMDLPGRFYADLKELGSYMEGSSGVPGLYLASILGLDEPSLTCVKSLAKAIQYVNFIRDINADNGMGRRYLPLEDMDYCGLDSLEYRYVRLRRDKFSRFLTMQLRRYRELQMEAEQGFTAIPGRKQVLLKTASELCKWTADRIGRDPMIIYSETVKPSDARILYTLIYNRMALR